MCAENAEVQVSTQMNRTWPTIPASDPSQPIPQESRRRNRLKVTLPVRLRPVDPRDQPAEELQTTINFNRHGIFFATSGDHYRTGMKLLVAFPYSPGAICQEYAGEVVRIEKLSDGRCGVAVRFLYIEARLNAGGQEAAAL
jgi:hypothetical protein